MGFTPPNFVELLSCCTLHNKLLVNCFFGRAVVRVVSTESCILDNENFCYTLFFSSVLYWRSSIAKFCAAVFGFSTFKNIWEWNMLPKCMSC